MKYKEINCLIGIQHMDQRIEYIYVNWDGDIHGVGRILHTQYQQREQVLELIMTGSRQSLTYYDLQEDGSLLSDMHKPANVIENDMAYFEITHPTYPIDYYYLYTLDATWLVYDPPQRPCALFTYFGPFS